MTFVICYPSLESYETRKLELVIPHSVVTPRLHDIDDTEWIQNKTHLRFKLINFLFSTRLEDRWL